MLTTIPVFFARKWLLVAILTVLGISTTSHAVPLNPAKLQEATEALVSAISSNRLPGGVIWIEHGGKHFVQAEGFRSVTPGKEQMTVDTIFDAASLTKVVATTPSVMLLIERGKIVLTEKICRYIPEFTGGGRENITVRQLLTHNSGLRPDIDRDPEWHGYQKAMELVFEEKLERPPDTGFRYSDINFLLLGELVHRVSGLPLDQFAEKEVFEPLGMTRTTFNPPASWMRRIAPTEVRDGAPLRGVVHDPTARLMGGVAGHAGLFTTTENLARYARMMLNLGEYKGKRIFKPETVRLMTSVQSPPGLPRRGLGWDIDSPYAGPRGKVFPIGSYGHSGWTGTSIWIDPFSNSFVILLANRNHPTEAGNILALRNRIATLAAEAITDFDFAKVDGALPAEAKSTAETLNGIDVLVADGFRPLKGKRVALITNHTGHDRERRPTVDLLFKADGVTLKALFSPEHGIRGALDEKVSDGVDAKTGLPIFSLYGERRSPTPEQLAGLDALVFDIQDIGCRFYTYISTMGLCLEAAGKAGIEFIVLDRANPLGGTRVEGPLAEGESIFTAFHPIPVRHGMTVGELARMINEERGFKTKLTVVPVKNWPREALLDQTGLPWTNPSPNMRSLTEALLYPGIGLLETTKLSVGRGTDTPFEVIGAPYIDDVSLARALNQLGLPGLRFVPIVFTPIASTFKGESCKGVNITITSRAEFRPVVSGLMIARTLSMMYGADFGLDKLNRHLRSQSIIDGFPRHETWESLERSWNKADFAFEARRKPFLLYP